MNFEDFEGSGCFDCKLLEDFQCEFADFLELGDETRFDGLKKEDFIFFVGAELMDFR